MKYIYFIYTYIYTYIHTYIIYIIFTTGGFLEEVFQKAGLNGIDPMTGESHLDPLID